MVTLGIDPGKSGTLCYLSDKETRFFDWPKDNDSFFYIKIFEKLFLESY